MEILDDSCDAQLEALWQAYQAPPVAPVAGCDEACLNACYTTLHWAVYSEKQQNCPMQEDIIRCFHVSCCPCCAYCACWACCRGMALPLQLQVASPAATPPAAACCWQQSRGRATAPKQPYATVQLPPHRTALSAASTLRSARRPALPPCCLMLLQVYRAQWLKFVNNCALFQYGSSVRLLPGPCLPARLIACLIA